MPKYHKLQRLVCLVLFAVSSVLSFFQYHTNAVHIAAISLIGVIAYDVVCYFKGQLQVKDHGADITRVEAAQEELIKKVQEIRDDSSIGKLAEAFKRK
jgi:hypothetical protein